MVEDDRITAFVGPNADYYRHQWLALEEKQGYTASFNIAACLLQVFWLAYRKLYLLLFLFMALMLLDVSLVLYVEHFQLVPEGVLAAWNAVVAILLLAVPGFFGNYWYWRKFRKVLRQAEAEPPEEQSTQAVLASKGGTNPIVSGVLVALFAAPLLWASYWLLPADISGYMFDRTGPLTMEEVNANFLSRMELDVSDEEWQCMLREVEARIQAAGDPETLDPTTIEMLPTDNWDDLDAFGRRLVLMQVITTQAFFACP